KRRVARRSTPLGVSPGSKTEPLQTLVTRNDPMRARASGHSTTAVARPPTRLRCSPSKFHRSKAGPAATRASRPAPKRATPSETSGAISQREPIPYCTTATPWPCDQAGSGVEDADRHAGAACAAFQAEFERRGPVRPHGRPSAVARCAAEPGHAELRGHAPLSRDAGRAERKTEPGEYGGRFQIHFIPKVIQPFGALFWPFPIPL